MHLFKKQKSKKHAFLESAYVHQAKSAHMHYLKIGFLS